jgi:hypothetical protein
MSTPRPRSFSRIIGATNTIGECIGSALGRDRRADRELADERCGSGCPAAASRCGRGGRTPAGPPARTAAAKLSVLEARVALAELQGRDVALPAVEVADAGDHEQAEPAAQDLDVGGHALLDRGLDLAHLLVEARLLVLGDHHVRLPGGGPTLTASRTQAVATRTHGPRTFGAQAASSAAISACMVGQRAAGSGCSPRCTSATSQRGARRRVSAARQRGAVGGRAGAGQQARRGPRRSCKWG